MVNSIFFIYNINMKNIIHNSSTWFKDVDFLDYWKSYNSNFIGSFKLYKSIYKNFDINNLVVIEKLANGIADKIISSINLWKYSQLEFIAFDYLEEDTRDYLRQAVCEGVQSIISNRELIERTNASSMSVGSVNFSSDPSNLMLSIDRLGNDCKVKVELSGIDEYEYFEDENLFLQNTKNGNTKIIAKGVDIWA